MVVQPSPRNGRHFDLRANSVAAAAGPLQVEKQPVRAGRSGIHQDSWTLVEASDNNVERSIVIEIRKTCAAMKTLARESDAHGIGNIGKGFAVEIAEHGVRL